MARRNGEAIKRAEDAGFDNAILFVLGHLNAHGDAGGTVYMELLNECDRDRIVAAARKAGEMRFTGLDKVLRQEARNVR